MIVESQTPSLLSQPPSDIITGDAVFQRAVEIGKLASQIILSTGIALAAACVVGIWALPLDLVMYSAGIKALAIPASLLGLPIVLIVCGIALSILNHYNKTASATYYPVLLIKILMGEDDNLEKFTDIYKEISAKETKINLSNLFEIYKGYKLSLSAKKLNLILSGPKNLKEIELNAKFLFDGALDILSSRTPPLQKITLYQFDSMKELGMFTEDDYRISHFGINDNDVVIEAIQPKNKKSNGNDSSDNSIDVYDYHDTRNYNDNAYSSNNMSVNNDISFAFEWRS